MPACAKCGNWISEKSAYDHCLRCGQKLGAPVEPETSPAPLNTDRRERGGRWSLLAIISLFLGTCAVAQTGIGVDRPPTSLNLFFALGLVFVLLGALGAYQGLRENARRAIPTLVVGAFLLGSCEALYLSTNRLPPFQTSDVSGAQYALHRSVPGEVRYTTGYTVAVSAPSLTTEGAGAGRRVWLIPVRFSNDIREDGGHVGRCSLYVDGNYRDPHRERGSVRALGDVDRHGVTSFEAGGGYEGRVAFEVPDDAREFILHCFLAYTVPTYFDLTPFAKGP